MKIVVALLSALVAITVAADLDLANLDELQKDERPVSPERLSGLIGAANRVVVTDSPLQDAKKLFESRERKDLDALSNALVVTKPDKWFHCMCIGTPAIYIYKDEALLALVSNHHGQSVRCSLWGSDARITDVESWLKWFDDRKIDGPRKEVEEMRKRDEQSNKDWKKWIAAIPKGIESIWEDSLDETGDADIARLEKVLRASIPKEKEQILALLRWFGSGMGPWSGFPSYESAAEKLLLKYPTPDIVSVIEPNKLTPAQLEGAARVFGGWDFSKRPRTDLDNVPAEIKKALWEQVKDCGDKDKLDLAKRAFKPNG